MLFLKVPDFIYNRKIYSPQKNQMIMRKKSGFTIVEQAIVLVPEFESVVRKFERFEQREQRRSFTSAMPSREKRLLGK